MLNVTISARHHWLLIEHGGDRFFVTASHKSRGRGLQLHVQAPESFKITRHREENAGELDWPPAPHWYGAQ
jgi:hypothetical protein